MHIISFCKQKMAQAERTAEKDSIVKIEEYKKEEKHVFRDLDKKRAKIGDSHTGIDYSPYQKRLHERIIDLKGSLLDIETHLQQALLKANKSFQDNVLEINNKIVEQQAELRSFIEQLFG